MKKTSFRSTLGRCLVWFVILNLSGVPTLFAQSFSDPQFGARVLFDRADRASDLSEWTNIAEDGFSELSESEQVNFEALLEDRLLRFSQDNFQQQMEKVNIALLLERLAEVNKHLLYQTDETEPSSTMNPAIRSCSI